MYKRLLLGSVLAVGILSGSAAQGTLARFTTVVTSTANQFSAGTLKIAERPTSSTLSMGDLIPGDNFDAQLDISNSGTLDLRYAMTTSITGDALLATDLLLTVRAKTTSDCSAHDGSVLYTAGPLDSGAFGNPAHGADAGDRLLSSSTTESLCFSVLLPSMAPTSDQGKHVAATFTFLAEQS
jgi:predicted ribosomally synthesized peptide with SipW-like signal peptide